MQVKIRFIFLNEDNMEQLEFQALKGVKVEALFDTPEMTTDFGALLLREIENSTGIISSLSSAIDDRRNKSYIEHTLKEIISQRVYQICQGYEDADDCDHFRRDAAFKTAVGRDPGNGGDLASQPTMSRLENYVTRKDLVRMGYALIDNYLNSFSSAPKVIAIDMDPSACYCHGAQQLSLFNAHEDEYCLMPFHVYDGLNGKLITTVIRPGKTPAAGEIIAILKRIVSKISGRFPKTKIVFRADSHHSKPDVHDYCDKNNVGFIIGQGPNPTLNKLFTDTVVQAKLKYANTHKPCIVFASASYQASTWSKARRIICRVIVNELGVEDVRYIVTSYEDAGAKYLYETVYCQRGNAELYIKDQKHALKSDRTSCNKATANQFRLFLHSAAYQLMHALRENILKGTRLARAQFDTIRLHLLKVAAQVRVMKTKITFHLPKQFPMQDIYEKAVKIFSAIRT